ncbi:MAG: NUDIX domain-containing protein [Acidobacteriota bacterium]|nr:NUDIX domain-containing protein [Blastocatellia bacterium]MDW8411981.1 NUDIX domain-containing protein [Acidobacteriota bacterium]
MDIGRLLGIGHKIRTAYWRIFAPTVIGVRALIVRNNEIMLVRHTYLSGWYLPGGRVERGETVYEALAREVREECRLEVLKERLLAVYANRSSNPNDHIILFQVDLFREIATPVNSYEIAEYRFFALDALPEGVSKGTLRRLKEYETGRFAGGYW